MANSKGKAGRKYWIIAGALLICGGAAGWFFYFHKREVIITVQTEKVTRRNLTELVVANGCLRQARASLWVVCQSS